MHEGSMANIECGSEALSSSDMLRYKSSVLKVENVGPRRVEISLFESQRKKQ